MGRPFKSMTCLVGCNRIPNLVWIVALLLWLGLTTSRYYSRSQFGELQSPWIFFTPTRHGIFERLDWENGTNVMIYMTTPPSPSPVQENHLYRNNDLSLLGDGLSLNGTFDYGNHSDFGKAAEHYLVVANDIDTFQQSKRSEDANKDIEFRVYDNRSQHCAFVEEMGLAAAGNVVSSSQRFRKLINTYFSEYGAIHVRQLQAKDFCNRGFVFGRAAEDGLGNDMYKILTAAGLGIMLNRSLIIGEHGSINPAYFGLPEHIRVPFGDYLKYSSQTFSISEVKSLWVKHNCTGTFRRPLIMRIDDFQKPTRTKVFCEDWTTWMHPIIWFKGTTDSNALQFFLKNMHPTMRSSAALLFGNTSKPDSRPNVFGELFKAFISPMPVIDEAVQWVLQGAPNPDLSVHLRMLNSGAKAPSYAMCNCIKTVAKNMLDKSTSLQVVVVTDTPSVIKHLEEQLEGFAKVIHFNYQSFINSYHNLSKVMAKTYFQPPEKRVKDWGSMPRWVAIVDLFLAARAKSAVISGANRRVGTTYAQLLAALTAAMRTDGDEQRDNAAFNFYSSFQSSLLVEGLEGQRGWGHTWRRFGGYKSCKNQTSQCAVTPLLPYAWWDGPWESPVPRDIQKMLAYGIKVSDSGQVDAAYRTKTCHSRKVPIETIHLRLPSCQKLKLCH